MLSSRSRQSGDTIIEVLFAIAVFSLIAVGGISIMNQGTSLAQRALETNLVRQQIDTQAETLRYINHAYVADFGKNGKPTELWQEVAVDNQVTQAASFDSMIVDGQCSQPTAGAKPFALNPNQLTTEPLLPLSAIPATYAKIRHDATPTAEGIWVQAVKTSGSNFYDFHIRACWNSPGSSVPATLGTIVRLYEPAA